MLSIVNGLQMDHERVLPESGWVSIFLPAWLESLGSAATGDSWPLG